MRTVSVLIVEDKAVIAESIAAALKKAGYSIAGKAESGEEALTMVKNNPPDVVLMDIQLAGKLDGIQTAVKIRSLIDIPIIYLTDYSDENTISRAKPTRPAAYLLKPFKPQDLLIAIEIAFYNASTGREPSLRDNKRTGEDVFTLTDRFFLRSKDAFHRLDVSEILWIKADRSYYEIQTTDKTITLVGNLNALKQKLTHPLLVRVHRSFIVNIDKVTGIKGYILMIGPHEIPWGVTYRKEINARFQMF